MEEDGGGRDLEVIVVVPESISRFCTIHYLYSIHSLIRYISKKDQKLSVKMGGDTGLADMTFGSVSSLLFEGNR